MEIKTISFDIFQTLVNVNKRIPQIWEKIYGNSCTMELAEKGAKSIVSYLPCIMEEACNSNEFMPMEEVYTKCAELSVKELNISISPKTAAYYIMEEHDKSPFYEEAVECMKKIHDKRKVIISSDSNHLMVDSLLTNMEYDKVFISEDLRSYKGDTRGRFFEKVLKELGENPAEILHVGDSISDIYGASRAGMKTCLVNRSGRKWMHEVKPDFEIQNLWEIDKIL